MKDHNRRTFLQVATAGTTAAIATTGQSAEKPEPTKKIGFQLGLASYSLRKFKLDQVIDMCSRVGIKNVALKSMHLPMNTDKAELEAAAEKVKKAGMNLYGAGVVYMKNEEQINQAFDYAKWSGIKVIIGVPAPPLLKLVDKKVKEYDIKVAIHNHGPGDKSYPTPETIYDKVKDFDKRIGICMDIGHTKRAGADPSKDAEKYADRLHDLHIKDVTKTAKDGRCVEMGRGVIDIPKFFRTIVKTGYTGMASFEFEKDPSDPLAGLAECMGYANGVLDTIRA